MNRRNPDHENQRTGQGSSSLSPAFKPVALPAVQAAVQAGKSQANRPKTSEPPPILRKQAMED
jgi:hypothetical protein